MAIGKGKSSSVWRQSGGFTPLTVTMESTGSAVAYMYDNQIFIECTAAAINKYVEVTTPIGFKVIDHYNILDGTTSSAVTAANGASQLSTVAATGTTDGALKRATVLDTDEWQFDAGDDDLRLDVATGAFTGIAVLTIVPQG